MPGTHNPAAAKMNHSAPAKKYKNAAPKMKHSSPTEMNHAAPTKNLKKGYHGVKPNPPANMGSAYKMKNSVLHMGAKHGTPIHANYASPNKSNAFIGAKMAAEKAGKSTFTVDGETFPVKMVHSSPSNMGHSSPADMYGKSPAKDLSDVVEGFKTIGRTLKPTKENIKRHASDVKEGFRQLFTGDREDSRKKKKN